MGRSSSFKQSGWLGEPANKWPSILYGPLHFAYIPNRRDRVVKGLSLGPEFTEGWFAAPRPLINREPAQARRISGSPRSGFPLREGGKGAKAAYLLASISPHSVDTKESLPAVFLTSGRSHLVTACRHEAYLWCGGSIQTPTWKGPAP